jgi:excinuclease UvrABC nuclease subunit
MRLASVNLAELPSVAFEQRQALPECSAVYFLLSTDGEVVYIGRTRNLSNRFTRHHRRTQFESLKIAWLRVSVDELKDVEQSAIALFRPRLNNSASPDFTIYVRAEKALIERLRRVAKDVDRPASQIVREGLKRELDLLTKPAKRGTRPHQELSLTSVPLDAACASSSDLT